jgi:hypothetical protein
MQGANDKIIVRVEHGQKRYAEVGGVKMELAKQYNPNRRESAPVVCHVERGNKRIKDGSFVLVHHNRFSENSPHHLGDNRYSIADNQSIYARLNEDGTAVQMNGNIIVERLVEDENPLIPEHLRKVSKNKFRVLQNGYGYKKGQYVFSYDFSDYEIVYVFAGKEHRVVKIYKDEILGKLVD